MSSDIWDVLRGLEGVDDKRLGHPAFAQLPSLLEYGEIPEGVAWDSKTHVYVATDRRVIHFKTDLWLKSISKVKSYSYNDITIFRADMGLVTLGCAMLSGGKAQTLLMARKTRQRFADVVNSHLPKPAAQPATPPATPPPGMKRGGLWIVGILGVMALLGVIGVLTDEDEEERVESAKPTPTRVLVQPQGGFSEDALMLRAAFQELVKIKDDTWFHVFCYAQSAPASSWAGYVNSLSLSAYHETGIAPGDLWSMGVDYCQNEGRDTAYTRQVFQQMKPDWVNLRPVPTPIPAMRIVANRPFADASYDLAECVWQNPAMHELLPEAAYATSIEELALDFEVALETGTVTTWDGLTTALTICENT